MGLFEISRQDIFFFFTFEKILVNFVLILSHVCVFSDDIIVTADAYIMQHDSVAE